jgi:hypothetical protein
MKNCAPQFDAKPPKLQNLGHVRKGRRTELDLGERGGLVPSLYLVSRTDYCPLSLRHLMSEKQFSRSVATAIDVLIMGRLLLLSVSSTSDCRQSRDGFLQN